MYTEVIFDIETKKLFDEIDGGDPADLGVSIVSLYKRTLDDNLKEVEGRMMSFYEEDFAKMWPLFTNADRVIGYNSIKFDVAALFPHCRGYDLRKLNHFDILDKIRDVLGFRIKLDAVAKETLGKEKLDVGINAVIYWNEHTESSLTKLQKYCEMDVEVTKDIYDFALKNGYLKFRDRSNQIREIKLDFSYPLPSDTDQIGLF